MGTAVSLQAAGEKQSVKVAEVYITITNLDQKEKDQHKFNIDLNNGTYYPTELSVELILLQQSPSATMGDHMMQVASCPYKLKLAPVETRPQVVHCAGGTFTAWKFKVLGVYRSGKLVEGAVADSSATEQKPAGNGKTQQPAAGDTVSKDGIEVSAERLPDEIKGFKTFRVTLKSTRKTDHSVKAEILLYNSRVKEVVGARGRCTVFVGLKAGQTMTQKKHCKESRPSTDFTLRIAKIFSKIF